MSKHPPVSNDAPSARRPSELPADCKADTLVVAFFDLSRFSEWATSDDDARVASFLQTFYALVAAHVRPAGGRVVKFMGDAGLAVFDKDSAEQAVFALCDLAREAHASAAAVGLETYLNVNVHVGPVLAGRFGPPGDERFDVIGKTVNIAARLGRRGVTLSAQAFRCLSPDGRKRFEKYTPPITYRFRG